MHNRDIYTRSDDSVVYLGNRTETMLRRSRGYCPLPIQLGFPLQQILGTKYAGEVSGYEVQIPVQHHHAHVASCMAENVLKERVIWLAWDGTGYGEDGCVWGGEFLVADFLSFERKAFFSYIPMPGGKRAIKEPCNMAISYLYQPPIALAS